MKCLSNLFDLGFPLNRAQLVVLLFFFTLSIFSKLFALDQSSQFNIDVRHITHQDGLTDHVIFQCVKDSLGFAWLAHRQGIDRFDGTNIKSYELQSKLEKSSTIIQMVLFNDHLILLEGLSGFHLASSGQIQAFSPYTTSKVNAIEHIIGNFPFETSLIQWFQLDDKGHLIFILSDHSIWRVDQTGNFEKIIQRPKSDDIFFKANKNHFFTSDYIVLSSYNSDQYLIIDKVSRKASPLNPTTAYSWRAFPYQNTVKVIKNSTVVSNPHELYEWVDGQLKPEQANWLNTIPEVYHFVHNQSQAQSQTIIFDKKNGIYKYNGKNLTLLLPQNKVNFTVEEINYVFFDDFDKVWFCTTKGLYIVTSNENTFEAFLQNSNKEGPMITDQMRSIYTPDDINIFAAQWSEVVHINIEKGITSRLSLPDNRIVYGIEAGDNRLLIGSNGIFEYQPNKPIKTLASIPGNAVWDIKRIDDHNYLICTNVWLYLYNTKKSTLTKLEGDYTDGQLNVFYDATLTDDRIWIVGDGGLYEFSHEGDFIKHYAKNDIGAENILCLYIEGHEFWMGSYSSGLIKWDRHTKTISSYTVDNGLPSNNVCSILDDDNGHLWLGTGNGLVKFNKQLGPEYIFSMQDGLPFNEFNRTSSFKSKSGMMYLGGINGFIRFDPLNIDLQSDNLNVPLRITDIKKYNLTSDEWLPMWTGKNETLTINPGERVFVVEFAMLDFESGQYNFQYQIEGLEDAWHTIKENFIRINSLPYGRYALKIQAKNPSGTMAQNALIIPIIVSYPFYLNIYFIIGVIIFTVFIIYLLIKWRERLLEAEKKRLQKLVDNKTKALAHALENREVLLAELRHRTQNNLTLIDSMLELQKDECKEKEAVEVLEKSQNRLRSISLIHHNLNMDETVNRVNFNTFLDDIIQQFQRIIHTHVVDIQLDYSIAVQTIKMDKAVPLALILNEWITNSIKHALSPNKKLLITIKLEQENEDQIIISYRDNGPGVDSDEENHTDNKLGLKLIHLLCKQLRGDLVIKNDCGVHYTLSINRSFLGV